MLQVVVVAAEIGLQPASTKLGALQTCGQEALLVLETVLMPVCATKLGALQTCGWEALLLLEPVLMLLRAEGGFHGRGSRSKMEQTHLRFAWGAAFWPHTWPCRGATSCVIAVQV